MTRGAIALSKLSVYVTQPARLNDRDADGKKLEGITEPSSKIGCYRLVSGIYVRLSEASRGLFLSSFNQHTYIIGEKAVILSEASRGLFLSSHRNK